MTNSEINARFACASADSGVAICSSSERAIALRQFILTHKDPKGVRELLGHFPYLTAFQTTLAEITGNKPFSREVEEAYWIGNELLKRAVAGSSYDHLLAQYQQNGAQPAYIAELRKRRPREVVFHHNFSVIWFGMVDYGEELTRYLGMVNNCMIRGGRIIAKDEDMLEVEISTLQKNADGEFFLGKGKKKIRYDQRLVDGLQIEDVVAVHWGVAVMKLESQQTEQLDHWTRRVVALL